MTREQFKDLLKRYRQGLCTPEERGLVDKWYAGISSDTHPFSRTDEDVLKEQAWMGVEKHISQVKRIHLPAGLTRLRLTGIAAAILVLVVAGFYWQYEPASDSTAINTLPVPEKGGPLKLVNDTTGPANHVLPDGSKITLLPGSSLSLSESFGKLRREVFLDGEAFFDVTRDINRPFLVYTNELTTEVLGTSFLIKAYKGQKEVVVTVRTGMVSVYTNAGGEKQNNRPHQEVILSPNQQVIYNAGEHLALKKLVNEPEVILPEPTLKDSYTNAPVIEILKSLEENYGIQIRYDPSVLANCTLTSDMSEEGFYEQIKIICNALGARYEITGEAVVIEATACSPR